jgi:hypothetical protein
VLRCRRHRRVPVQPLGGLTRRGVRRPAVTPVATAPVGDACKAPQAPPAIPEPYPESAVGAVRAALGLRAARVPRAIELATRRGVKPQRWHALQSHARRHWRGVHVCTASDVRAYHSSFRMQAPIRRVIEGLEFRDGLTSRPSRQQAGRCNASRRMIHGDGSKSRALTALRSSLG